LCHWWEDLVVIQFLNILWGQICTYRSFYSRHTPSSLIRHCPLIHPPSSLAETLTGDRRVVFTRWGFPPFWPRVRATPVSFAVFCGSRGLLVIICCRGSFDDGVFATRAVAGGDFLPAAVSIWCFLLTYCI